jgi:hypothetical protein
MMRKSFIMPKSWISKPSTSLTNNIKIFTQSKVFSLLIEIAVVKSEMRLKR